MRRYEELSGVEPQPVNGQPGAIFRDSGGKVLNTWTFDILDGEIQMIRSSSTRRSSGTWVRSRTPTPC
jgi:hypothetical protein